MPVEVPIWVAGRPTGRAVRVPDPPPAGWTDGGDRLELQVYEVCRRFGCGCIWEDARVYVPEGSSPPGNAAVRVKDRE